MIHTDIVLVVLAGTVLLLVGYLAGLAVAPRRSAAALKRAEVARDVYRADLQSVNAECDVLRRRIRDAIEREAALLERLEDAETGGDRS